MAAGELEKEGVWAQQQAPRQVEAASRRQPRRAAPANEPNRPRAAAPVTRLPLSATPDEANQRTPDPSLYDDGLCSVAGDLTLGKMLGDISTSDRQEEPYNLLAVESKRQKELSVQARPISGRRRRAPK
ncbi:hypothetical protein PR048_018437 [Dryococelus australis]|uniref:Uncharacterized protein n=1 Tax=Dryococelus australis TaxID=614101 RepID=A0ABQ9HCI2_9NEOP|nr:hypothetical protein PR048_018437 [Dryococelus australis]